MIGPETKALLCLCSVVSSPPSEAIRQSAAARLELWCGCMQRMALKDSSSPGGTTNSDFFTCFV